MDSKIFELLRDNGKHQIFMRMSDIIMMAAENPKFAKTVLEYPCIININTFIYDHSSDRLNTYNVL